MLSLKKQYWILFLCLISAFTSKAQSIISTNEIDVTEPLNFCNKIQYFSCNDTVDITTVLNQPETQWKKSNKPFILHIAPTPDVQWIKFRIANTTNRDHFFIQLTNRGINVASLYQISSLNKFKKLYTTGDYFPFSQRPYLSVFFIFPVEIPKNDTVTYLLKCDKKKENLSFGILLTTEQQLTNYHEKATLFIGIFVGFFFMAFITNIFLLFIFKERIHLWYGLYLLSVINMIMSWETYDFQFFFPNKPFLANISKFTSTMFILSVMIHVMQLFFKQKPDNSRFYHAANYYKWFIFMMIPITILIYGYFPDEHLKKIHFYTFIITQDFGLIFIIICCIEKIWQRYQPAYFYLAATLLLFYTGIETSLIELGIINRLPGTPNRLQWCFTLETIIVLIGILYRYYLIRAENKKLFEELNEQKLNTFQKVMETQHQVQSRIASDLHDVIGSQLASIKLSIAALVENKESKHHINQLMDDISANARNIAHNLHPSQLNDNPLAEIISNHIHQLNKEQAIVFSFQQTGKSVPLTKEQEINLYPILTEIIHNILKHSNATNASIQFFFHEKEFLLIVEDNGKGFDYKAQSGLGIKNLVRRVSQLTGDINVDSSVGNTTIIIKIPLLNGKK